MTTEDEKKPAVQKQPYEIAAISAGAAFKAVVPEKIWLREIAFALQILRASAATFKNCNTDSIRNAVINVALTGATLNPALAQAFLVPRTLKGRGLCCILEFSYRGLANIAVKSFSVYDIDAVVVYANDEFYMEQGLEPILKHVPTLDTDRGDVLGVYAIAIIHHGIKKFIWLPKAEVDQARDAGTAKNSLMWKDWYGEGARKTAVKKLYKLLPQTDEMGTAVALANEAEGIDFDKEKLGREKGNKILDRFNTDKKDLAPEPEDDPGTGEPGNEGEEPDSTTLEFEERITKATDIEALNLIFAEYELTRPASRDLKMITQMKDNRVIELKGE